MSNVAVLRTERPVPRDYLGPADVLEVAPTEVLARVPGAGEVRARLALAFTYAPRAGDVVLLIGRDDACYVIGVLHATGTTTLAIPGDVEVAAIGGELRLSGDKGVRLIGPEVEVRAGKLSLLAGAVVERFTSLRQHVAELLSVRAGEAHTVVDEASYTQAKSATLLTEDKVTINGKAIHLG